MYIVTIAARISSSVLVSEARNASAAPWKLVLHARPACRCSRSRRARSPSPRRRASAPRREVERDRRGRELAEVVDRRAARAARSRARSTTSGTCCRRRPAATYRLVERLRARAEFGLHLEHHAVLVRLREDGRDQALAEGVVERVVDRRGRDAERARRCRGRSRRRPAGPGPAGRWRRRRAAAALQPLDQPRHPSASSAASAASSVNWYCVRLTRSSIVRSCTGCM